MVSILKKKKKLISYLASHIPRETLSDVIKAIESDSDWAIKAHHYFGMVVRNKLREGGFRWNPVALDALWAELIKTAVISVLNLEEKSKENTFLEDNNNELNIKTKEYIILEYINKDLFANNFREYLRESRIFRETYKKNSRCVICSSWDTGLFECCNLTFCESCLSRHRVIGGAHREQNIEYKVMAINHGAAINFSKEKIITQWRKNHNFDF